MKHKSSRTISVFLLIAIAIIACNQFSSTPVAMTQQPATVSIPIVKPTATAGLLGPTIGSPGLGDSLYPNFGNGGYQVEHYTLDITVNDVSTSKLTATTTIASIAAQDLTQFNLDFIGFDITSLNVDGESAKFSRDGQELTITPATMLSRDQAFTVEVQYNGSPSQFNSIAIPVQTGWVTFDRGSFVLSEPDGAATFYPVNDHPLDKASFTFLITVPKPYEVAANGILTETIDNGNTTTFHFEAREPMASYLATVNIDEFDVETMKSPKGIPIRNYYATDLPKGINKPFARQGEMLDYYSGVFGPYPFEVYGSLVLDTYFGAALENQTMSIYGVDMINVNDIEGTELVVAHELTHQWFGDSVSVADWSDIWLNEGFATYGEGLWIEHNYGRAELDQWVKSMYADMVEYRGDVSAPGNPPADDLFNWGVYEWGGLTLHALRLEVGDEAFIKILRTYFERYEGGNATTDDFIAVAEEVSGQELSEFFNKWLYSGELPPIPELGLGTK